MWTPYDWEIHQSETDRRLEKRSYLRSALLTSATLATPGRGVIEQFDEFASSIGIIRHQHIHNTQTNLYRVFEPVKFGTMSFVLADPSIPSPTTRSEDVIEDKEFITSPEWLDYCAFMIRQANNVGGRCLVLSLSFKDTGALAERLSDLSNLIVHNKGQSLTNLLTQYISNPNALLITPAAWEGVNLPGMVNQLVVTRIPFAPLDGLQYAQLSLHLQSKGYDPDKINSIIHNERVSSTRKKLKQGFGRAIRDKDDIATVWIADPRFPLPSSISESLDEIVLSFKPGRIQQSMESCIAKRFLDADHKTGSGFALAKILLADGRIYQPTCI
jgi:ATP-dependent DNA helicase DinG